MLVADYFVNPEQIESERTVMVVLDVSLDNFYAFKNFHMKLTYPKKIVGSSIKEEHLEGRPNFRYKKVNIIIVIKKYIIILISDGRSYEE